VEGRLVGAWAKELEHSWKSASAAPFRGNRACVVDLTGILFIDEEGRRILTKLFREGASFRTAGPMTESIVSDITRRPNSVLPILLMAAAMFAQSQPLHDAVEMAPKQNPQVQIANLNMAVTQENQIVARSALLPQANLAVSQARAELAHATGQMESLYAK
jgi:hypothetical protein